MCNPAIALAVLAVTTTAATVVSEVKAANAQNKAISQQYKAVTEEVHSQEVADINERARAARREQGRIRVAAGEAGLQLTGSVAGLLQDSSMQSALYEQQVRTNAGHKIDAATAEANSMYSQVQKPSVVGAGLRIVQSGVSGYLSGSKLQLSRSKAG